MVAEVGVLVLDSSALLCRYLPDARRAYVARVVTEAVADGDAVVVSALARSEVLLALHQSAGDLHRHRSLWGRVGRDWDTFWEVPMDGRCMARATEIGAKYGLSVANSVHLAAADRLPGRVDFCTLDRRQIPAVADLGFHVRSPAG